jgi:hypothetical protein
MNKTCSQKRCYVAEGESCLLGNMTISDCEHYSIKETNTQNTDLNLSQDSARVPWSGNALGLNDLVMLTPRSSSILVGILGAHDAGKTTFLLGNYLNCIRGDKIAGSEFAGSWTLGAWEAIAAWSRFDNASQSPQFPPHTARGASRCPGLLHLALRRCGQKTSDVLLTDAPGEWFSSWSINENTHDTEGARWTVDNSNAFLVFADSKRLSGKERGKARNELRQLIERLGSYVNERPVVVVWSKSDEFAEAGIPEGIKKAIKRALNENIPHAVELKTSIKDPETLTKVLATVLDKVWQPNFAKPIIEPVLNHQPFSAFRGHHAE